MWEKANALPQTSKVSLSLWLSTGTQTYFLINALSRLQKHSINSSSIFCGLVQMFY
jgi:hypothetical protein